MEIKSLIRPSIKALKPYSSARDEFQGSVDDLVFLDANENPFENGVNRYPDPQQKNLKAKIASLKGMSSSNILLGNGSDEVLDLLFRTFCEPNQDQVIILRPTYGMYEVLANINAVEVLKVNLIDGTYEPNIEAILELSSSKTKILFICSPNNPTGNSFNQKSIQKLIENFSGLVVIDEAYIDFSSQESWLEKLDNYPNLVVTQTLSKAYGMAGLRLGICFASAEIISTLNKVKPPYNVNSLTQAKALEVLSNINVIRKQIEQIKSEKNKLISEIGQIKFVKQILKSDANFILIKVDDANFRYTQLIEKGIVVRNRTTQPLCENTLRLTVGTPEENTRLLEALKTL